MRDKGIGCLPVGENDKLIGMLTDRDITCRMVADGLDLSKTKARDVMSKGIIWCFEDQSGSDKADGEQEGPSPARSQSRKADRWDAFIRRSRSSVRIALEGAPSHGRARCLAQRKGPTGALAHSI